MRRIWILIVLAACGSKTPPAKEIANTPVDAGAVAGNPAGCPATFAEASGSCDPEATPGCAWPEGSCWCGAPYPCTGVELPPEELAQIPVAWQCTPTPPAVRADGCPGTEPNSGSACGNEGQSCSYGDCCVTNVQCTGGQWQVGMASCPP